MVETGGLENRLRGDSHGGSNPSSSATHSCVRPRFSAVSDDMKRLCALLGDELLRWPDVSAKPMFGMRAFYRGATIFAILPEKRALDTPRSIGYKLATAARKREGQKWQLFELADGGAVNEALAVLERAYRKARATQ